MLEIMTRGNNQSVDLDATAFTQDNFPSGRVNSTLSVESPKGCLGGSVAGISGNAEIAAADETKTPVGWFLNNAVGNPYENSPAVASGKGVYYTLPGGLIRIDVYETHTEDGLTALTYAAQDVLYTSKWGLATKEAPGVGNDVDDAVIGIVLSVPTASDPFMTVISKL